MQLLDMYSQVCLTATGGRAQLTGIDWFVA